MDLSVSQMRLLLLVEEHGSVTDVAALLGTPQSTVSRRVSAAERAFGAAVFRRSRTGMEPTTQGLRVLRSVSRALRELEGAGTETDSSASTPVVRVGAFPFAALALLPEPLARVRRSGLRVELREGPSPRLVRMLRAGVIDLALITTRPPHRSVDGLQPQLRTEPLLETELAVAVAASGRFGARTSLHADELRDEAWIGSAGSDAEPRLGVWPGLPGRPEPRLVTRDWAVTFALVAAGLGVSTVPVLASPTLPAGVALVRIDDVPAERRRVSVVFAAPMPAPEVLQVADAVRWKVKQTDATGASAH